MMGVQSSNFCRTVQIPSGKLVPAGVSISRFQEIIGDIADLPLKRNEHVPAVQQNSLLLVRSGNSWMDYASQTEIPKMLFGEMWHEGELCILFADTNVGKSILAVQIADSISRGVAIGGFRLESPPQPVLYIDFEMSSKQFEARYSIDYECHYTFSDKFLRAEVNPDAELPKGFQDFETLLLHALEQEIVDSGAKVVIVDNITYLKDSNEKAKEASPLMKHLKKLKQKYSLSLLVLAHTPKRDMSKPITRNDLAGSKMLINFCDSAFTIGESSQSTDTRYLKQIKARNTDILYGGDNVCLCHVQKPTNFLKFEFSGFAQETSLLKIYTDEDREQQVEQILALKRQGLSNVEIGKRLHISEGTVRKRLKGHDTEEKN